MADAQEGRPAHPPALRALALHGFATASPATILLFRRPEIAEHLDVLGSIVGEAALIGVALCAGSVITGRLRNTLPMGSVLLLGALLAAVGLGLMAWTIEVSLFTVGGLAFAVGSAPAVTMHRVLLATDADAGRRFRTLSWYWAAVSAGAGWPLGLEILADPSHSTLLWICCIVMIGTVVALGPHALLHDEDHETEVVADRVDVPWAWRSNWAAFGAGMVVLAGPTAATEILVEEWQRSPEQTAAVLGTGLLASAAICAFGPWYHRLARLRGSRRADAIGVQVLCAGALASIGALSFTYIGLIVSWSLAGGLLGLAASGLDAAVFPAIAPHLRRAVAVRQVLAAAAGALVGILFIDLALPDADEQLQLAVLGLPLIAAGFAIRRFADPAVDDDVIAADAAANTVPRRVLGIDGTPYPVLKVEGLDVAYGAVQVLFGVDLEVRPGQVVALLGTNGAGKTTLLRTISGLEPALDGRVVYAGLDITKTRPTWRVGMGLHQIVGGEAVAGPLTVDENLRLFAHTVPADLRDDAIADALQTFPRLAERREQNAETLSGGEKQMLALAKALIVRPRLLLIDEFSLGLAPRIIAELLPAVRTIADRGAAVLLVEQSVNIALSVADHAYLIEKGEIGFDGAAADLRSRPELLRSAYLEGLSQALEG